jgi:hypothetical protein
MFLHVFKATIAATKPNSLGTVMWDGIEELGL